MEIKQHLNDAKKESQENEKAIDHYRLEHDKLKLEEVEYVTIILKSKIAVSNCQVVRTMKRRKGRKETQRNLETTAMQRQIEPPKSPCRRISKRRMS